MLCEELKSIIHFKHILFNILTFFSSRMFEIKEEKHKHYGLHALTPSLLSQAQIGSIMVWLCCALVTGCISWNKLEPEP